jgi:hypothetical protein
MLLVQIVSCTSILHTRSDDGETCWASPSIPLGGQPVPRDAHHGTLEAQAADKTVDEGTGGNSRRFSADSLFWSQFRGVTRLISALPWLNVSILWNHDAIW